ncbi:site-specific DNA-methyltransferase [Flavobacterium sp. WC2421]|uniref:DNA-methyltransferase n=1 Tax=Flavobacterium sp. WC2421 TaxID=3234138 RepID=UPI003466455D
MPQLNKQAVSNSTLFFNDCFDVFPIIKDKSIDMIFCDLPYGTTNCSWDSVLDLPKLWKEYERVIKDNGAIILTAQTPFDKVLGVSNLKLLRYEWIWEKTTATGHYNAKKMPMKAHENVLIFYKNLPTYNPIKTQGHKPVNSFTKYIETQNGTEIYGKSNKEVSGGGNTDRYPRSVQIFASDKQKLKLHSTQKPAALTDYFIETYSNEGDVILDNCMGSGTTGDSCERLNRKFIGIENLKVHFDTAVNRITQYCY